MALINSLFRAGPAPWDDFWYKSVGSQAASSTGLRVDAETALKLSVVWACATLISESIAMLPLIVYHRLPNDGKERATTNPLYSVLHDKPNANQTSQQWRQQMTMQMLLRGTGLSEMVAGPGGFADQLVPLDQSRLTKPKVAGDPYILRRDDGPDRSIPWANVLRLPGPSIDGLWGMSVIEAARESMGIGLAAEQYAGRVFSQDGRPRGVIEHPAKLSKEAREQLAESWANAYAGLANAHKVAVLWEGMKFSPMSVSPEDAQMLESREFSVEDICRWFRVPPHMVGSTAKVTSWGTGIEQLSIGFVTFTLLPWLVRWEQAIGAQLIAAPQWYFAEHVVDGLLRGDQKTRYEAYQIGVLSGWLSINDVRRFENMNPVPGGDEYRAPLNSSPVSQPKGAVDGQADWMAELVGRTNGHAE